MTPALHESASALERLAGSKDAVVRSAAQAALDRIRSAYR